MIEQSQYTLAIVVMAIITFSVRYAFFMNILKFDLHPTVKNLLTFTAPCVLTALFVPIMFQDMIHVETDTFSSEIIIEMLQKLFQSSYFWASIATIILSLLIRQTLVVIILSMLIFYGLRTIL